MEFYNQNFGNVKFILIFLPLVDAYNPRVTRILGRLSPSHRTSAWIRKTPRAGQQHKASDGAEPDGPNGIFFIPLQKKARSRRDCHCENVT